MGGCRSDPCSGTRFASPRFSSGMKIEERHVSCPPPTPRLPPPQATGLEMTEGDEGRTPGGRGAARPTHLLARHTVRTVILNMDQRETTGGLMEANRLTVGGVGVAGWRGGWGGAGLFVRKHQSGRPLHGNASGRLIKIQRWCSLPPPLTPPPKKIKK